MSYGPNNPPPDRCAVCDDIVVLEEPVGACLYTGGACLPGGCDCGTTAIVLCSPCAQATLTLVPERTPT